MKAWVRKSPGNLRYLCSTLRGKGIFMDKDWKMAVERGHSIWGETWSKKPRQEIGVYLGNEK